MTEALQAEIGSILHAQIRDLFPICRSITGNGVRETLRYIQALIPIEIHEIPSGTQVLDWTVPNEWNIREAWIQDSAGKRIVDFRNNNLHVVNYSLPVRTKLPLHELKPHLHSLPDQPDAIPYRTSYYREDWGFCLSHRQLEQLPDGEYDICIDSTLVPGSLSYGELFLPGTLSDEVLFSTHVCHPSLANDNLSGIVVATEIARQIKNRPTRTNSYRFLFVPGTIGAITWLAENEGCVERIKHGLVVSGVGDDGPVTYKRSRIGNATIDRIVNHVLQDRSKPNCVQDFVPYGYDERQYCSPGFNLAVGCLSRTPWGKYRQYHTSNDNLEFVKPESLAEMVEILSNVVELLELNRVYRSTNPKGEPQMGRRGLYNAVPGGEEMMAMLWILNLADGSHSLLDIAERSKVPITVLANLAKILQEKGLIQPEKSEKPHPT